MKICIIGQSKRLQVLENNLIKSGYDVEVIPSFKQIRNTIFPDFAVLPVPTVNKDGFINLEGERNTVYEVLDKISEQTKIISCGFSDINRNIIDLNSREDFAYLNAIPTAEGAIYFTLQNTERSLFESRILITGFGRVAKVLADRLKGLCNNITVAARSPKDLSLAEALGFSTVNIYDIERYINHFDLVYQTVPKKILNSKVIDNIDKNSIIIELSSKSIGTDFNYAETLGIKVVHAAALPEKVSPITAGNILTKSVLSIISEQN